MALIVQKYGGSSVGTLDRLNHVSQKIIALKQQGHEVVVVISAMYGETDRLIQLAYALTQQPNPRDYDVLLATGEQVSMALLSMALNGSDCTACCFTSTQIGLYTDNTHTKARITRVETTRIQRALTAGQVVIVAGFQGINEAGEITTLGRGGSDATAVALAVALHAKECQIYTDVNGVYTTDPHLLPQARLLPAISFTEMLEMASSGSKILQKHAVELASAHQMPLRVLSTFSEGMGTMVLSENYLLQTSPISGIAFSKEEAILSLHDLPHQPGVEAMIIEAISQTQVEIDMLIKQVNLGKVFLSFTLPRRACQQIKTIIQNLSTQMGHFSIQLNHTIAKLSLIGMGIRGNTPLISTVLQTLTAAQIPIHSITTSEFKISVTIDEAHLEESVRTLHTTFKLDTLLSSEKNLSQASK